MEISVIEHKIACQELNAAQVFTQMRQHVYRAESVLKIIYTWAGVPGGLNPEHVKNLCAEALGMEAER